MSYTQETADSICNYIAQGNSLVKACKILDIDYSTVFDWIKKHEDFANNYTHAREAQADYLADGVLDIADDSSIPADDKRIRVDARKWYAGKLKPKKYGERQSVDVDVTSKGESMAGTAADRLAEMALRVVPGNTPDMEP
jgi:hypothetical protein